MEKTRYKAIGYTFVEATDIQNAREQLSRSRPGLVIENIEEVGTLTDRV